MEENPTPNVLLNQLCVYIAPDCTGELRGLLLLISSSLARETSFARKFVGKSASASHMIWGRGNIQIDNGDPLGKLPCQQQRE